MRLASSRSRPRRPTGIYFLPAVAFLAAILVTDLEGCQQLFTTSLATALARSSIPIPSNLSTGQAADLAAQAKANQDTALATALVSSLVAEINSTTDPATKASLEASAASAAIVASGVGTSLTTLVNSYETTNTIDTSTLSSLLTTVQAGATPNVVTALSYIGNNPSFTANPASSGLGATDLAIAAVVVAASVIPPGTNPSTVNLSTLPSADQPQVTTAKNLITAAATLAGSDPAATSLLNQISGSFSLPTTS